MIFEELLMIVPNGIIAMRSQETSYKIISHLFYCQKIKLVFPNRPMAQLCLYNMIYTADWLLTIRVHNGWPGSKSYNYGDPTFDWMAA